MVVFLVLKSPWGKQAQVPHPRFHTKLTKTTIVGIHLVQFLPALSLSINVYPICVGPLNFLPLSPPPYISLSLLILLSHCPYCCLFRLLYSLVPFPPSFSFYHLPPSFCYGSFPKCC